MADNSPKPTLNPALYEFWRQPARNRVLYGGRGSSKSWDAAGFAVFLAVTCKVKFLCARQFQNKIEESVYTLLKTQIYRFGLQDRFRIYDNKIVCKTTGSEFVFYGLWRSIEEIRSLEGIDVCWIEEAHGLTEQQWKVLEPTIRKEGSQFWLIFNPLLVTDFVYRKFVLNPPPNTLVRKINYDENPFLSKTLLDVIEAMKAEDAEAHQHIYLGEPETNDDDAIIKRSWLLAAVDAHKALGISITGRKRLGFDIADSGSDECALVYAHGSLASWSDKWKGREDELLQSCSRAWSSARERQADIVYDAIGVGASAGAKFNELNNGADTVQHSKFFAGGAVLNPERVYQSGIKNADFFSTIKAQAWWDVADRLKNTYVAIKNGRAFNDDEMIFIDSAMPNLDRLIDELSQPKRTFDKNSRVKVEGKDDLKKRGIPSPNLADAFIMAFLNQPTSAPAYTPMRVNFL